MWVSLVHFAIITFCLVFFKHLQVEFVFHYGWPCTSKQQVLYLQSRCHSLLCTLIFHLTEKTKKTNVVNNGSYTTLLVYLCYHLFTGISFQRWKHNFSSELVKNKFMKLWSPCFTCITVPVIWFQNCTSGEHLETEDTIIKHCQLQIKRMSP